ncbi:MAG: DNA repair protein RadC [Eubacteriales bacterium]|nr:DNA repair protein RadC [Eubacteriales bacterium]
MSIKTNNSSMLPIEKAIKFGVHNLEDRELLAIIISSGTKGNTCLDIADTILNEKSNMDGLVSLLDKDILDFQTLKGIGQVKSVQLSALSEISKRIWKREKVTNLKRFQKANDIANFFMQELRNKDHEELHLMLFNISLRLITTKRISVGSLTSSYISMKELTSALVKEPCAAFAIVHNHPSGDPEPSSDDFIFTKEVLKVSMLVEVHFIDHIIIGDNKYYSFKEEGFFDKK